MHLSYLLLSSLIKVKSETPFWYVFFSVEPWNYNCYSELQSICLSRTKAVIEKVKKNEWMMHLYSALLCIVHTQSALQSWRGGGGSLLNHHQCCSIHLDDATAATGQRRQCAHHTPATGGKERERHRANQVYALTTHQLQVERRESHRDNQVYALTTHQLQVERRESHRDNQV